jgi:hypothetical protein
MPRRSKRSSLPTTHLSKDFYTSFKIVRDTLLACIGGCSNQQERERCTSFLLHSLTFLYFLQQKGYFDSDSAYLSSQLHIMQTRGEHNAFLPFYLRLLLKLFPGLHHLRCA